MTENRSLYLMISQTDTLVGQFIRCVSRYPYNHVSITLDPKMREWYSFARYMHDAPFYSGFVKEPAERFLAQGGDVQIKVFRLEIPESRAVELEQYFAYAGRPNSKLLYNYFDAIACGLGLHIPIPYAHTCLSFACSALGQQHASIKKLADSLQSHLIYSGSLSALVTDSGCRDDRYFSRIGLIRGTTNAAIQFSVLSCRLILHGFDSYMANRFHRTVH